MTIEDLYDKAPDELTRLQYELAYCIGRRDGAINAKREVDNILEKYKENQDEE